MSKIKINRTNQHAARVRFGIVNDPNLVLHHKDITLMYTDPERYNEWRDEDLVVMDSKEHTSYHHQFYDRSDWNYAEGERNGANTHPEKNNFINNNPGKKLKGTHYYNNGEIEVRTSECPEGFVKGRLEKYKNNPSTYLTQESYKKISYSHRGKHRVYRPDGSWYMEK